jgi:hypothetical protein
MSRSEQLDKIVLHYKDGKPKVIKEGLVLYTTNNDQDALGEFLNIDDRSKLIALSNALGHTLQLTLSQWDMAEQVEKEGKANREKRDI